MKFKFSFHLFFFVHKIKFNFLFGIARRIANWRVRSYKYFVHLVCVYIILALFLCLVPIVCSLFMCRWLNASAWKLGHFQLFIRANRASFLLSSPIIHSYYIYICLAESPCVPVHTMRSVMLHLTINASFRTPFFFFFSLYCSLFSSLRAFFILFYFVCNWFGCA